MEEIKSFLQLLQTLSPLSVIALLGVIIFILVRNKDRTVEEIFKGTRRPATLDTISDQLRNIAGNHLHDLPAIREDVTKILTAQTKMQESLQDQGERMVRVETLLGIGVPERKQ